MTTRIKKVDCKACGGSGRMKCILCDGHGMLHRDDPKNRRPCNHCDKQEEPRYTIECHDCGGNGKMLVHPQPVLAPMAVA